MADAPVIRPAVDLVVGDCTIQSRPLPYTRAEDLQPDIYGLVVKVVKRLVDTLGIDRVQKLAAAAMDENASGEQIAAIVVSILPALDTLFDSLRGGELKRMAPLILFSTAVVFPNIETGAKQREELALVAGREAVFDVHPELYWVCLFHAGRVSFARFFPGKGLAGFLKRTAGVDG